MASVFIKILNLSISASMLVILVLIFRAVLKNTSRRAACLLWVVVGLRLIIPFSFESSFSFMPSGGFVSFDTVAEGVNSDSSVNSSVISVKQYLDKNYLSNTVILTGPEDSDYYIKSESVGQNDTIDTDSIERKTDADEVIYALPTQIPENTGYRVTENSIDKNDPNQDYTIKSDQNNNTHGEQGFLSHHTVEILAYIWLAGVAIILGYALVGYVNMRIITSGSVCCKDSRMQNVYICDRVDTAFIFGIINPKIYLPDNLNGNRLDNVIAHEKVHLKRRDYIWKMLGFLLLTVYWFNPIMWLAYSFICKDIEFACDEQVISKMNPVEIKEYSDTLLFCSTNLHFTYGCPLAFGEAPVKDRVKAALSYKKPLFWVIILAFILLVSLTIFFFTKSSGKDSDVVSDSDTVIDGDISPTPQYPEVSKVSEEYKVILPPSESDIAVEYNGSSDVFGVGIRYYRLKNGLYEFAGNTYKYRLEISGKAGIPLKDITLVYLSNIENIDFTRAWMAAMGLSSSRKDYFDFDTAARVDGINGNFGKEGKALEIPEEKVKSAILKNVDPAEEISGEDIQYVKVYYGSFTGTDKLEAYCTCKLKNRPHTGGVDFQPGVLVDLETGEISDYYEFRSDETSIGTLSRNNGADLLVFLGKSESTGSKVYTVKMYSLEDGFREIDNGLSEEDSNRIRNARVVRLISDTIYIEDAEGTGLWEWKKDKGSFSERISPTPIDTSEVNSVYSLLNTLSRRFKYNMVQDYEFTYIMPNGTELKHSFGYNSGLWFKDYEETWPEFEEIIEDESLMDPRKNENGYLVVSTDEDYLNDNQLGYRIYIKDGYVHLYSYDNVREYYLWSGRFKDDFQPNMYSIRRILFTKDFYDIYVQIVPYEEEISEIGFYPVNRPYLIDLDGDGTNEKVFIASCGWINQPEPDNVDGWVDLSNHSYMGYKDYYGINSGVLVYINGKLYNNTYDQSKLDMNSRYSVYSNLSVFALTDVNISDGRYEIYSCDDMGDIFYVYNGEEQRGSTVSENPLDIGHRVQGSFLIYRKPVQYDGTTPIVLEYEFIGEFYGNGTFTGPADVSLTKYNFSLGSDKVTWTMDADGNIERIPGIYDVPNRFGYIDETNLDEIEDERYREYVEDIINNYPESIYLKLEVTLKALIPYNHLDPDSDESRVEIEPGYVRIDQTDGISWIHIRSPYTGLSGWIDVDHLEKYVKDYDETGLKDAEDFERMDIIFSNINHLP